MIEKQKQYNQTDLENIAKGACFLASGGGGTYDSGKHLSNHFVISDYYKTAQFNITDIDDIDMTGYAVVVAYIGAPEAIKTVNYPKGAVRAVEEIQRILKSQGHELKYVVPVEVGALSSIVPCLVASKLHLSVINGDGAGRAVPELTMLSFSAEGVSCKPTVMTNSDTFTVDLNVGEENPSGQAISDASVIEKIARPMLELTQFNQIAGLAIWVMTPAQIKTAIKSKGSLLLAKETGEKIAAHGLNEVMALLTQKGKKIFHLFSGTFDEKGCTSLTAGGFDHGTITITDGKNQFINIYQNELLLAWKSNSSEPAVMAPDSITFFVEDEQKVYSVGDIMDENGQLSQNLSSCKVHVIGIAAEEFLRNNDHKNSLLDIFTQALKTLGYYGSYKAIEDINT